MSTLPRRRPELESLEGRRLLSWAGIPPSTVSLSINAPGTDHFTFGTGRAPSSGNYSNTSAITRNEVDYYSFTAQRNGSYTFQASAAGSPIDTVEGLFDIYGRRLAYNDDASRYTYNSKFSYSLHAGTTYWVGITNYSHTSLGSYSMTITAPNLNGYADTGLGAQVYTIASATLSGTNLQLVLYGHNGSDFNYQYHSITVKILDMYGQPIHSGVWYESFQTAGSFIPGTPSDRSQTWNFNVGFLNLTLASRIWVQAAYD